METSETSRGEALPAAHRAFTFVAVAVGVIAVIVETDPTAAREWHWAFIGGIGIAAVFCAADLLFRAWRARPWYAAGTRHAVQAFLGRVVRPTVMIDVAAALAVPAPLLLGLPPRSAHLFGLLWMLKLVRYCTGLSLLGRVLRNSFNALVSVLLAFVIVMLFAGTMAFLAESGRQPEQFGSIPAAMWWAVVTLTTTGYGDLIPVTPTGRILAGAVMVCGIGIFAMWAGIIASGFADEFRRHDFLRNWDLVARVPFFRDIGADLIAEVARLLRRRDVSRGQAVMRQGQPGEAMYFIVSGSVDVLVEPSAVRLGPGQFFGEMALITGEPRRATVLAAQPCLLLELDVADFRTLGATRPGLLKAITAEMAKRTGTAPAQSAEPTRPQD